ncbi:MAG: hypothetical protein ACM3S1_15795 [Hyphomicrobiales bacterium]
MATFLRAGVAFLAPALLAVALLLPAAHAQVFGPPSTVLGSVADSEGPIPADLEVIGYIDGQECGRGTTWAIGEGEQRVALYAVDVVSEGQIPGCGAEGKEITLKFGDRMAAQTAQWKAGAVRLDVTFGDATPAPIPTSTPTPGKTSAAAGSNTTPVPPGPDETPGTIPGGSPGAGSPMPTLKGGVASQQVDGGDGSGGDSGGGFPIWAVVVLVLGGIAAIGGGVGYAMSRNHSGDDDDFLAPQEPPR